MTELPITTNDIIQILEKMTDEDRNHFAELVMIRMSKELYQYIANQSWEDNIGFGEWVRRACVSYGHHRDVVREGKNNEESRRSGTKKEDKKRQAN